jgi:pimeloyl-ACP methyl ester carboxylesterase
MTAQDSALAQDGTAQATTPSTSPATGYAPVNGLEMYYEIHGTGGVPLLLLHGGLFNIDLQFGSLTPELAATRQVIAADFQAHGRTNDIDDRPLSTANLTSDVVGLLAHLGVEQVDVFGYSVGGAVALALAIWHPELVRKAVISSVSFNSEGDRTENQGAMEGMSVEMIAGTPMEQDYLAKSPNPDKLQQLLDKLVAYQSDDWTEDEIKGIAAPTLITVGDCDMVRLDHAVRFLQLRGGDVNGDFVGVPASQLAVLPGTTHFFGLSRPSLVLELVVPFLDAPMPGSEPATPTAP